MTLSDEDVRESRRNLLAPNTIDDGPVAPPSDDELYAYLGPQRRWVQVCMTCAFLLAGMSLAKFSLHSAWMWPLLIVLLINVSGAVISALSGWNKRQINATGHRKTIENWALTHATGPSVDVYLPTCGEDLSILRNTYRYVSEMRWSGELRVIVLDDGDRPEVEEAAREIGFDYLVRPNRGHMKKAGNLQYAFGQTSGEFIVIFDADFCPRADFLEHLLPYTEDDTVGIVQSPQYFSTAKTMGWLERTAGATQELFYRWVQPSRDTMGAPICVGTCAVYRRAALNATGGFAQIEHSEDVHTGIFLMRAGFRTKYIPIVVAQGLCPSDLAGFLNQQYRWCNGSITLLRSGAAQRHPLSVRQRFCFWAGFMYYISTAVNVFAIHIPGMVMALMYADQVRAYHFVPFMAGAWVYFVLLPRTSKCRWRFEVMRTQMAYSFCHALAIVHKLTGRTKGWVATGAVKKGGSLARTISYIGIVTITLNLVVAWAAWGYDVHRYGLRNFWAMGLFLGGYSYLAIPLLLAFLGVVGLVKLPRSRPDHEDDTHDDGAREPEPRDDGFATNRITMYEAVAYTILIGFATVLATGYFDLMIPGEAAMTATLPSRISDEPRNLAPSSFRSDIEGLRAISILGVVLFHASVPHFAGGFVGVDVFFVISGFLITGLLLREAERRGRIAVGSFYARRAKRLLPPAAIVIAATAIGAWLVAPPLAVFTACFDLLWSVFYVGNWRFIAQGNDYLAGNSDYNVALHYWSLAVEEQFYLVWPALLVLAIWVGRRRGWPVRKTVVGAIALVSAASLTASIWLTYTEPALAYMATYTRAWQFGAGALLAVLAPAGIRGRWSPLVGWLGVAAVLYSVVFFNGTTPYPGWAALIPTLGAAAIIGATSSSLRRALSVPVLRLIGRWSYPWYLWHWPILVLAEVKFGHLQWPVQLALMVGALALAGLTHHFVEVPVASARDLKNRMAAAGAVGLIATVVATATVLTVGTQTLRALGTGSGASTTVSFDQVFGRSTGQNSGKVVPAPISARADIPKRPECLLDRTSEQPKCTFGAAGGTPVVLFGDSHAHQWQSALSELALQRKWELTVIAQSGCPVPNIEPRKNETARYSQDFCRTWRQDQIGHIVDMKPAVIIVSSLNEYIPQTDELLEDWSDSLTRLAASGAKLVYIRDTPFPRRSVPECISSALNDWSRCAFQASTRVDPVLTGVLQNVLPPMAVVDMNGYLCDGTVCPAVRNGIMLYRDDSHLSDTAVRALTPALGKALDDRGIH